MNLFDLQTIQVLLERGADPNLPDSFGQTPLVQTADIGIERATQVLLEGGADPNRPNDHGNYPLILATINNNPDVVKTLLHAGADLNQTDGTGPTALSLAERYGYWQIVESLGGRRPAQGVAQLASAAGILFRFYDRIRS